jgi:hypothetical protein
MEIRIEIDCSSFLQCLHENILTLKRLDVNNSYWVL